MPEKPSKITQKVSLLFFLLLREFSTDFRNFFLILFSGTFRINIASDIFTDFCFVFSLRAKYCFLWVKIMFLTIMLPNVTNFYKIREKYKKRNTMFFLNGFLTRIKNLQNLLKTHVGIGNIMTYFFEKKSY